MSDVRRTLRWGFAFLVVCAAAVFAAAACLAASDDAEDSDDDVPPVEQQPAAPSAPETALGRDELAARLAERMGEDRLAGGTIGLVVIDTADGEELFAANGDAPLVPASNMKLATTAAALVRLGGDWKFHTLIGTLGKDLVVVGGGDPNLSDRFYDGDTVGAFRAWAAILKSRGVTRVEGDLVFDDSLFDAARLHPHWPAGDIGQHYAAPVGALTTNDSCVNVYLRGADQAGPAASVRLDPATAYLPLAGTIQTQRNSRGSFAIDVRQNPRRLAVSGTMPPGVAAKVYWQPVDDPGLFAATVIRETLAAEGVTMGGGVVRRRVWTDAWRMPEEFRGHILHTSTLAQTIRVANTRSQNLYAECLLKTLAAYEQSGAAGDVRWPTAQGTWPAGGAAVRAALGELGLATDGCVFDDGSGLSPENRLTASLVAGLLTKMAGRPDAGLWMNSLAAYGQAGGSIARWPKAPALEGRVRGKTGKLTSPAVRCLSGYVRTRTGRTLAFSILANNFRGIHYPIMQWAADVLTDLTRY